MNPETPPLGDESTDSQHETFPQIQGKEAEVLVANFERKIKSRRSGSLRNINVDGVITETLSFLGYTPGFQRESARRLLEQRWHELLTESAGTEAA